MEKGAHMLVVGDFVLNTNSRKLYDQDKKEVSLPPTLFSLLKFFIDHQNQLCSKDMIIDNVWKGKIVVEANVNQNIKKLRDVLGDSANDPKYIETVTGEGFRFIANSEEYKATPSDSDVSHKTRFIIVVISIIVFLALFFSNLWEVKEDEPEIKELFPLTTLKGLEHYPNVSSNREYLLFNHKNTSSWDIYLKPMNKESYHAIVNTKDNEWFPVLSHDQTKLLYFLKGQKGCGLVVRSIDLSKSSVGKPEFVKECDSFTERLKAVWIDENEIFISINEDMNSAASIYQYNIKTREQKLISKPDVKGFGDYAFKYSRKEKKLAYIRNIGWSSSEIWLYDLVTKSHRKLKSTELQLHDLDWLEGGRLLYQSGNKEVSSLSLDDNDEQILAKFPSKIYLPFSVDNQMLGVVIGEYNVIDIGVFDISRKEMFPFISSSFNDYFAARGNNFTTFVSNRTGDPQIWVRDEDGNYSQVTNFEKSFEISGLSVSKKFGYIIFNKSGHINIIDRSGELIFNSENYSNNIHANPSFDRESDWFYYAIQYQGEWNIEMRTLNDVGKKTLLFEGASARACVDESCVLFMKDNDPYLYKYFPDRNTSIKLVRLGYLGDIEEWDVYDRNHVLYIDKGEGKNKLVKLNLQDKSRSILLETDANTFNLDKEKNKIYMNIVSQGNIDLMQFSL